MTEAPTDQPTAKGIAISVGLGCLFMLLIAEVVVRVVAPQNLSMAWMTYGPHGLVLNRADVEAVHQLGERKVVYRINTLHMRGGAVREDGSKVLIIGDSFSFGWLVDEMDSIAGLLQKDADRDLGLGRVQFLNAGTGGWGTDSYLAYIETFGTAIAPDAVLILVNAHDLPRSLQNGLYTLKGDGSMDIMVHDKSSWRTTIISVLRGIPGYQWMLGHSHLVQFVRTEIIAFLTPSGADDAEGRAEPSDPVAVMELRAAERDLGWALFHKLKQWGDGRGIPILAAALYWPGWDSDREAEIMSATGIPFLDLNTQLRPVISHRLDDYKIHGDAHLNESANILIVDRLWPWLRPHLDAAKSRP